MAATDAVAAAFTTATLKPKRLASEIQLSHELIASVVGIEAAFRQNLTDAMKAKMSNLILNGVAPTSSAPQNVQGFFYKTNGC